MADLVAEQAARHCTDDGSGNLLRVLGRRRVRHDLVGAHLAGSAYGAGQLLDVEHFGGTPVVHRLVTRKRAGGRDRHATHDKACNQ